MTSPSRTNPPCQFMQVPSRCLSMELAVSNFSGLLLHFLHKFKTAHDLRTGKLSPCQTTNSGGREGSKRHVPSSTHVGSENRTMMECSALCSTKSQTSYFTAYTFRYHLLWSAEHSISISISRLQCYRSTAKARASYLFPEY